MKKDRRHKPVKKASKMPMRTSAYWIDVAFGDGRKRPKPKSSRKKTRK